jgi:hypothetical protein
VELAKEVALFIRCQPIQEMIIIRVRSKFGIFSDCMSFNYLQEIANLKGLGVSLKLPRKM